MRKIVFGLNRADGSTFEEFKSYWLEEHAPIAEGIPELRRYTVSFPDDPEEAQYDGMAQVYFDDHEALIAGLESDAGTAAANDIPNFANTDDMLQLILDENVVVG